MEPSRADRILERWDRYSRQTRRPGLPIRRRTAAPAVARSTVTGLVFVALVVIAGGLYFGVPRSRDGGTAASNSPATATPSNLEASLGATNPSESGASSAQPSAEWGPLAVIAPPDGTDLALAGGVIRVTEECVYLESSGELTLLFWPADLTTWVPVSREIAFTNADATTATVGDGDRVALGGGGDSEDESGVSGEDWVRSIEWVAEPAASCALDRRFGVGAVFD
jgi:hypothetical protein